MRLGTTITPGPCREPDGASQGTPVVMSAVTSVASKYFETATMQTMQTLQPTMHACYVCLYVCMGFGSETTSESTSECNGGVCSGWTRACGDVVVQFDAVGFDFVRCILFGVCCLIRCDSV